MRVDPAGNEIRALFDLADLRAREVLEIGCGDGRLTWRYAQQAAHVTAIDPFGGGIDRAKERLPDELKGRVEFHETAFDAFSAAREPATFDIAILSWSLC
jgi:ubiquinone/menaquinone biosynthesis C-methylase UbiE